MYTTRPSKRRRMDDSKAMPDLTPLLPAATQSSCPLFTVLPAEIRNRIYSLSLESEDTARADDTRLLYQQNAFYYRPGYQQPRRIQTALLQTCQRIYDEASLLPPALNEHTFWYYRAPPHVNNSSSPLTYFRKMTPEQRAQVRHLHFFTQQYFLENNPWSHVWHGLKMGSEGRSLRGECRIAPTKLTITLRHTDWWFWESDDPLGIDPFRCYRTYAADMGKPTPFYDSQNAWGNQFTSVPSLEELVIEFETVMRKRDQLDDIAQRALQWKFPIQTDNSMYLVADSGSKRVYTWVGADERELQEQGHQDCAHAASMGKSANGHRLVPTAPTLKPFDTQASDGNDSRPELDPGTEEFYVVFLTWKKQLVEA